MKDEPRQPTPSCDRPTVSVSRRRFLIGTATAGVIALAGCADDAADAEAPDPVDLADGQACDVCGMVIADHYGPNGQIFYAGDRPADRDGPAWFDSLHEAYEFHLDHVDRGWEPLAVYVTDYSSVDYTIEEYDGERYVSTHPEADAFVDAERATFVAGSAVNGAMGPDLVPFTDEEEAAAFADEHGGELIDHDEIDRELLAALRDAAAHE